MSSPKVSSSDNEKNQLEQLKWVFCYFTAFIIGIKKMHSKLQDNKWELCTFKKHLECLQQQL
jgi:hypothetical protein